MSDHDIKYGITSETDQKYPQEEGLKKLTHEILFVELRKDPNIESTILTRLRIVIANTL